MLNFNGQVCVQSPTYAENVALFAFAAAHLAAIPCCRGASRAAIDRYLLRAAGTQQQTRRTTDRRTDWQCAVVWTLLRILCMRAVPIKTKMRTSFTYPISTFYQTFFVRHRHTFPPIHDILGIVVRTFFEASDQYQIYIVRKKIPSYFAALRDF